MKIKKTGETVAIVDADGHPVAFDEGSANATAATLMRLGRELPAPLGKPALPSQDLPMELAKLVLDAFDGPNVAAHAGGSATEERAQGRQKGRLLDRIAEMRSAYLDPEAHRLLDLLAAQFGGELGNMQLQLRTLARGWSITWGEASASADDRWRQSILEQLAADCVSQSRISAIAVLLRNHAEEKAGIRGDIAVA